MTDDRNVSCNLFDCVCDKFCDETPEALKLYGPINDVWQVYSFLLFSLCFIVTVTGTVSKIGKRYSLGTRKLALVLNLAAISLRVVWALDARPDSVFVSFLSGGIRFSCFRVSWCLWTICVLLLAISWGGVATRVKLVTIQRDKRNQVGFAGSGEVLSKSNKRRRARNLALLASYILVFTVIMFFTLALDPIWHISIEDSAFAGSLSHYLFKETPTGLHILATATFAVSWIGMFFVSLFYLGSLKRVLRQFRDEAFEDRDMVVDAVRTIGYFRVLALLLSAITGTYAIVMYVLKWDAIEWRLTIVFATITAEALFAFTITMGAWNIVHGSSMQYPVEQIEYFDAGSHHTALTLASSYVCVCCCGCASSQGDEESEVGKLEMVNNLFSTGDINGDAPYTMTRNPLKG